MKILIMGTGGVGGYFGAKLALNKNNQVTFVARGQRLEAIKKDGLNITAIEGNLKVENAELTDSPEGIYDLILCTVKNFDLESATTLFKNCIGPDTLILPLENGITAYQVLKKQFKAKVLVGVAYIITSKSGLNEINQIGGPCKIIFGSEDRNLKSRLKIIEENFKDSKINVELSENPLLELWSKFIFICAFAGITAITRQTVGVIRKFIPTKELYISLIKEGMDVAKRFEVYLSPNFLRESIEKLEKWAPESKSSLLTDLENNTRTEVDYLNGEMVKKAKEANIEVPINEFIYSCIKVQDK